MFEQDFENMLRTQGAALDDKKRFTALVRDLFPAQARNVNLLLMAYSIGIAQDIQTASDIDNTFAFRYVKQLIDNYGMSRANADWVVSVWCSCYGAKVLGKRCEIEVHATGPAISNEENKPTGVYGDLFDYCKSQEGNGLAVTGFHGQNNAMLIFQNKAGNQPVLEVADDSFAESETREVIITDGIERIGNRAFAGCADLHQVILPGTIKELGDQSFAQCEKLTSLMLPESLERIGSEAFKGTGLKTIAIPKNVYWLGDGVFSECEKLDGVTIPENIKIIPDRMFEGCLAMKKISLHRNVEEIGERAFFGCELLDGIEIPDSVRHIGQDAFSGTSERFILQCSMGSYAESYARKNKIKYQLI